MRDVHVHFLHGQGEYSNAFFEGFISAAQKADIDEIYLLEHTHQFYEFEKVYTTVKKYFCKTLCQMGESSKKYNL